MYRAEVFRKAGVPRLQRVKEKGLPGILLASVPLTARKMGGETFLQAGLWTVWQAWAYWGLEGGYFTTEPGCAAIYDEMRHIAASTTCSTPTLAMVQHRACTGSYGIRRPAQGHYYVDH